MRFADLPTMRKLPGFIVEMVRDALRTRRHNRMMSSQAAGVHYVYAGARHGDVFTVLTHEAADVAYTMPLVGVCSTDEQLKEWRHIADAGTFTFAEDGAQLVPGMTGTRSDLNRLLAAANAQLADGPIRQNRVPFTGSDDANELDRRRYGHSLVEFAVALGIKLADVHQHVAGDQE